MNRLTRLRSATSGDQPDATSRMLDDSGRAALARRVARLEHLHETLAETVRELVQTAHALEQYQETLAQNVRRLEGKIADLECNVDDLRAQL